MPADNAQKLKDLLAELFMFDRADLDFGIYRIMNAKRSEITSFLENDLLPQVKTELGKVESGERASIEEDLQKAERAAQELGVDPSSSKKVQELRAKYAATADPAALEDEVLSHLVAFFRRYYKEGDFISLRRYKKDVYALPYEGEEVKLHWANADQYYIKSSENFRDYTFALADGRRVHFKLVDADTEANNNKPAENQERRFVLVENTPVAEQDGELIIPFEYRVVTDKQAQPRLNEQAIARILSIPGIDSWLDALRAKAPTEKQPNRTLLEKHLNDYTESNTFDYFIHKDLRGFLSRELDFYIKNEIMLLDDIEHSTAPRVEQHLAKIRAVRAIARSVIDMLAQLENFQKKLWLKKKFVVETNYCVTLDRVPAHLYPAIASNDAQRAEWVRLFAIDNLVNTTISPNYSVPLTLDFLHANPFLVLDTRFFSSDFKARLLASFDDLDAQLNGLLVHSENFQALSLLETKFHDAIQCVYLDPPYNTSEATFNYKNEYKHSSWMSMMQNRVALSRNILNSSGILAAAIDDAELYNLEHVIDANFGSSDYIGTVIVQANPRGRTTNSYFATSHEYCLFYARDISEAKIYHLDLTDDQAKAFGHNDDISDYRLLPFRRSGGLSTPEERPNSYYPIFYNPINGKIDIIQFEDSLPIYPIDSKGKNRVWRQTKPSLMKAVSRGDMVIKKTDEGFTVLMKDRIKEGRKPKTIWTDSKYDASTHGTVLLEKIFGETKLFSYPKALDTVIDTLSVIVKEDQEAIICDIFGGSGTTGHAVINLNREDGGARKYILVEMGTYFDAVTKPRILKVIYSKDWKDGKPVSREGSSHLLKYIRLESYEDALNNLELRRDELQTQLLKDEDELRKDYMLRYMLDVESRGSASLLNTARFAQPFDYTMKIAAGTVGETRETAVDLVETFNYLLGLRVAHIETQAGLTVVTGHDPEGQRVLIIWRDTTITDNAALDAFFEQQGYKPRAQNYDLIYVNGDNNLENLRPDDETWKVRLIEEEFQRRMFDVRDV